MAKGEIADIMSNFSFCHNVFKSRLLLLRQHASAGGKGYTIKAEFTFSVKCFIQKRKFGLTHSHVYNKSAADDFENIMLKI